LGYVNIVVQVLPGGSPVPGSPVPPQCSGWSCSRNSVEHDGRNHAFNLPFVSLDAWFSTQQMWIRRVVLLFQCFSSPRFPAKSHTWLL